MRRKNLFCLLLPVILLCSCGENAADNRAESLSQVRETEVYASLYTDDTLGIEIRCPVEFAGSYMIICGEQSEEFETDIAPDDIREVTVSPWGKQSPFLLIEAVLKDGSRQVLVLNSEMMSEVMLQDPVETARDNIEWEIVEKDETLWLYMEQESLKISAEDRKALEVLANTISPTDEVRFDTEGNVFVCDVPVDIYGEGEIGIMRLCYEYDGVGMNCIDTRFIPAA